MQDQSKVLEVLRRRAKAQEAYEVTEFVLFREPQGEGHGPGEIRVELWDAGEGTPAGRYFVYAFGDNGTVASGNPANSIQEAIDIVNWGKLDVPESADPA